LEEHDDVEALRDSIECMVRDVLERFGKPRSLIVEERELELAEALERLDQWFGYSVRREYDRIARKPFIGDLFRRIEAMLREHYQDAAVFFSLVRILASIIMMSKGAGVAFFHRLKRLLDRYVTVKNLNVLRDIFVLLERRQDRLKDPRLFGLLEKLLLGEISIDRVIDALGLERIEPMKYASLFEEIKGTIPVESYLRNLHEMYWGREEFPKNTILAFSYFIETKTVGYFFYITQEFLEYMRKVLERRLRELEERLRRLEYCVEVPEEILNEKNLDEDLAEFFGRVLLERVRRGEIRVGGYDFGNIKVDYGIDGLGSYVRISIESPIYAIEHGRRMMLRHRMGEEVREIILRRVSSEVMEATKKRIQRKIDATYGELSALRRDLENIEACIKKNLRCLECLIKWDIAGISENLDYLIIYAKEIIEKYLEHFVRFSISRGYFSNILTSTQDSS